MTTVDFITDLFCRIDDEMRAFPQHPQAQLWPSEVVTLGVLHALEGVGNRAFYRWPSRDYHPLFPQLPERTRLFRSFVTHRWWTWRFLAQPTLLGVIDSYGIELIHPIREGRSPRQMAARASPTTAGSSAAVLVGQSRRGHCRLVARAGPCARYVVPALDSGLSRSDGDLGRYRVSCPGGRSARPQGLSARHLERPYADRNGVFHADADQSHEEDGCIPILQRPLNNQASCSRHQGLDGLEPSATFEGNPQVDDILCPRRTPVLSAALHACL